MRYPAFSFLYDKPHSHHRARLGVINTPNGQINTPAFIFCATKACIKTVSINEVKLTGTQAILANTYHLMLQPGEKIINNIGGLQKFTGWKRPMMTDSGGFQIFSLGHGSIAEEIKKKNQYKHQFILKISEDGILCKSHVNGKKFLLSPEKSMQIQRKLGADLIITFDECTPFHIKKKETEFSMCRSHRWTQRSFKTFNALDSQKQALYGVIQGGIYPDLRKKSCHFIKNEDFFGYAIGGSLGAQKKQMYNIVSMVTQYVPANRPIHLLGIGGVKDIISCVKLGVDTFDCVHPTRLGRHGNALIKKNWEERINLMNACYRKDYRPIELDCPCSTCQHHTRAYLHYLLKSKEPLGKTLITIHNINFINLLFKEIRQAIKYGDFINLENKWCMQ